jgi:DNA-binding MarR family transcriptional regulator
MSNPSQPLHITAASGPQTKSPVQAVGHLLKNLHLLARQTLEEALRVQRIDMSLAHLMALLALESTPGIPGAELARRAFVTAQTMNTILRRLEREGDIEREPHPERSRADSWFLTKNGRGRLKRARVIAEAVWLGMLSPLRPAEIKQMQDMLERCIRGMDVQPQMMKVSMKMSAKAARTVSTKSARGSRKV